MNEKKRWQIAVLFSVFIHLIVLIVFAWQINKWLPTAKPMGTQEDAPVFIDNSELENSDNDAGDDTADDEASGKSGTPAQPDSDIVIQSDKLAAPVEKDAADTTDPHDNKDPDNKPPKHHFEPYDVPSLNDVLKNVQIDPRYPPPRPELIKKVKFQYPDDFNDSPYPFKVELSYWIFADGHVGGKVTLSSGYPEIDQAAIDTISQWQFKSREKDYPLPIPKMFTYPEQPDE